MVHSDTAALPRGDGTMGSRSLQVGGSAVVQAATQVLDKARALAAHLLEAPAEDVAVFPGEGLGVAGAPSTALAWAELAAAAADPARRPPGMDAGLEAAVDFEPERSTFPFGAHLAVCEVDTETGLVRLLRHVAVDDAGRIRQPDAGRGAGAWRDRPGGRPGPVRGGPLRRGRQLPQRQPGQLRHAGRGRPAGLRDPSAPRPRPR